MSMNFRYPNITANSEREQILQIKSFLHQLVEQLNYALPTISSGDASTQQASEAKTSGTYDVQGGEISYYELRSLIIQEIQKLDAQFDQLLQGFGDKADALVDEALKEAIESGEFTGPQGETGEKGDKGDKGDTGPQGEQGPQGEKGEDGADGVSVTHEWNGTVLTVTSASGSSSADLKGDPGENGADGYTPIKGEDYYTEEDKQEIIGAVLAALAAGEQ